MTVRRFPRVAAALSVLALGLLTSCGSPASSTAAPSTATRSAGTPETMKTLPPSGLCTALTAAAARKVIADARPTTQVGPDQGDAPDVCGYASADGASLLSLTPATRAYAAELSAAHDLRAHPGSAGMRDVRVTTANGLGRQAFRETAYQVESRQHVTFVVWNAGTRTWVLTHSTTTAPVPADDVVRVARSVTARLPTGT